MTARCSTKRAAFSRSAVFSRVAETQLLLALEGNIWLNFIVSSTNIHVVSKVLASECNFGNIYNYGVTDVGGQDIKNKSLEVKNPFFH